MSESQTKTLNFTILKRNRVYFAATKNGYKCKIIIDENSENLELGNQDLIVIDESITTKYGTDAKFRLFVSADEQKNVEYTTLSTPIYNTLLIESARNLGGTWDSAAKVWVFPDFVSNEVEALDEKYNSEKVVIEINFNDEVQKDNEESFYAYHDSFKIAGFVIATAFGRDSGAKINTKIDVAFLKGGATSGGSAKNWTTLIVEDSILKLKIPKLCLPDVDFNYTIIEE